MKIRADIRSEAPAYTVAGITFQCWVVDRAKGDGSSRYEWRSRDGLCLVGRYSARQQCWAIAYGDPVPGEHLTLRSAMLAAVMHARRAAA